MKFKSLKSFSGRDLIQVVNYLIREVTNWAGDLSSGLQRLNFTDNFKTFTWSGTIGNGDTVQITHAFGAVPSGWIIVRHTGDIDIVETGTWTNDFAYLINNGAADATITVIFFRD